MQNYPIIKQPLISKNEGVKGVKFPKITPSHFCFCLIGKPGSGKSHLIKELITNQDLYFKKFDKILFITPSKFNELQLNNDNSMDVLSPIWIQEKIQEMKQQIQNLNNVLIVLDDVVGELNKLSNDPFILSLFFNRRHLIKDCCISIILTTQKYTVVPARFRSCFTGVFMFQVNKSDWKYILQDLIFIDTEQFKKIYEQTFKNKYNFLYVLLEPYQIHINFKPID